MLSDWLFSLHYSFSPFNVFRYVSVRAVAGAFSAFVLCFLLMPYWIAYVRRHRMGQVVRREGPRSHIKKEGTPTMGGLVGLGVGVVCILLWARPQSHLVWLSLLAIVWYGTIGFIDDWLKFVRRNSGGLSARAKLLWQFIGAFLLISVYALYEPWGLEHAGRISLPFIKHTLYWGFPVYLFISAIVVVGTTNAVNLSDGLDGLAAGCSAFAAAGLGVYAYLAGSRGFAAYLRIPYVAEAGELAVICGVIVGVCLGILWYNSYPADVFMGDVGALGLGGVLGALAVFIKAELVLAVFGGVFVAEGLSVLFQVASFRFLKRRILRMAPLHHHFELGGVPESKVIVRFWIFSLLLIIMMLGALKIR